MDTTETGTDWAGRARAYMQRGMRSSALGAALIAGSCDFRAGKAEADCPFSEADEPALAEKWLFAWHNARAARDQDREAADRNRNRPPARLTGAGFIDKSLPPGDR